MGLIQLAKETIDSVVRDQFKEVFHTEDLGAEILVKRCSKRNAAGKNRGNDDVISNGSVFNVPPGTALVLMSNGAISDFTLEEGFYRWDAGAAPSLFGREKLGEKAKSIWKDFLDRGLSGAEVRQEQKAYFVNMREILDNKFGSPAPIPYVDPEYRNIYLRLHGAFSFKIVDPIIFIRAVVGSVDQEYYREAILPQMKIEFISKISEALNRLGAYGDKIPFGAIPSEQSKLTQYMNQVLDEEWTNLRGMIVVSVGIASITPDDNSKARIEKFDQDKILAEDENMRKARFVAAQSEAMTTAAGNTAGAATGIMGMGFLGGMNAGPLGSNQAGLFTNETPDSGVTPNSPNAASVSHKIGGDFSWICSLGHKNNNGKFCSECGEAKIEMPVPDQWVCSCGQENTQGKFCSECGKERPILALKATCSHCGWEASETTKTPNFCPECGKKLE